MGLLHSSNGPDLPRGGPGSTFSLLLAALAFALALGVTAVPEPEARPTGPDPHEAAMLTLGQRLEQLDRRQRDALDELSLRTGDLEQELRRFTTLQSSLATATAEQAAIRQGLQTLQKEVDSRFEAQASARAATSPTRLRTALKHQVLDPVFQVTGDEAVGSAVLVYQEDAGEARDYYALSCYHVIRDIMDERGPGADPLLEAFDALFFDSSGEERRVDARLMAFDANLDLALLRIRTHLHLPEPARLAPLERAKGIEVFSAIYTVGCPLGTYAQATYGQITNRSWQLDDEQFWMVSSPAYFGNSGGGVFLEESRELIGIFAKIYTHGSFRPQVITHMGLVIPLQVIHQWLEDVGHAYVLP